MNAYFASVEQAEDPGLQGRPIAVVPMIADSTFVIAASVEAKRLGVKTGMQVGEARMKLPELTLVHARPPLYTHYHRRILQVVEDVLPVEKVSSIDEMRFRLLGRETEPAEARRIALEMKQAIHDRVSDCMTCSIGIAPNSFLAKLATDLQKPDGLVVIESSDLPDRLKGLKLTEFAGINRRMEARLKAHGIFRSDDLIARSEQELRVAFGSVIGAKWWRLLRGEELPEEAEQRKSLSHSHVLPPDLRTDQGSRDVLLRLAHKACARLRSHSLLAGRLSIGVSAFDKSWKSECRLDATCDTLLVTEQILRMWEGRDFDKPRLVWVAFHELATEEAVTPSLFEDQDRRGRKEKVSRALDRVNQAFGKNSVYLASLSRAKDTAEEKIAFNKTWLFSEGKEDNEWGMPAWQPPEP